MNQRLVLGAYLHDCAFIDILPVPHGDRWLVTASDERGNSYAEATFDTENSAQEFINRVTYPHRENQ